MRNGLFLVVAGVVFVCLGGCASTIRDAVLKHDGLNVGGVSAPTLLKDCGNGEYCFTGHVTAVKEIATTVTTHEGRNFLGNAVESVGNLAGNVGMIGGMVAGSAIHKGATKDKNSMTQVLTILAAGKSTQIIQPRPNKNYPNMPNYPEDFKVGDKVKVLDIKGQVLHAVHG